MDPATTSKALSIATPNDTTIVLTRTFNAPRRLVWEAMFTPEKMRRWMQPPPGWTLTVCECVPRVAGTLRLVWKNAEGDATMALLGVFSEAIEHERIVHTEIMVLGSGEPMGSQLETHEFTEVRGMTSMRITQVYASKDARDGAMASGMEHCLEPGFKSLDELLAQSA